ncbi:hypothetical protein PYW08_009686 [Mythimna loreyi]|uniref:Uncharacterized protein n=1 Tax=Mythimna loreyi TaxID=667449 RepID=A0ACC2Q739_9NEOP|nr:hypothetical protein PYW08_009686 [Mythimna loreyi]
MTVTVAGPINSTGPNPNPANYTFKQTRRILKGHRVGDTRPYMVYLRAAQYPGSRLLGSDWVCGGVIIHERYILTSAACIEEAKHFYVVSGTNKWIPYTELENECIVNGAKKAIWKCVPKSYVFDGEEFDNIRWMVGDIAVVKVEDAFNFEKRVRGCDFVPKKVDFNNRSEELEKARSFGSIAGWGSTDAFEDILADNKDKPLLRTTTKNSIELMEADVQLISEKNCKQRWDPRYHFVIDEQMVCTKDITDDEAMSSLCAAREVNCKELEYSDNDNADDYDDDDTGDPKEASKDRRVRRMFAEPGQMQVHTAGHFHDTRRKNAVPTGGFCENDHGGPLIVGQGKTAVVIGVMSACLTKDVTRKCYGPFLFTSVFRYKNLINCAIDKELGATCRMLLRSSKTPVTETFFDWSGHKEMRAHGTVKKQNKQKRPVAPKGGYRARARNISRTRKPIVRRTTP